MWRYQRHGSLGAGIENPALEFLLLSKDFIQRRNGKESGESNLFNRIIETVSYLQHFHKFLVTSSKPLSCKLSAVE